MREYARTYAKLINHQPRSVVVKFVKKGPCLLIGEVLETPLQDPAPVRVRC